MAGSQWAIVFTSAVFFSSTRPDFGLTPASAVETTSITPLMSAPTGNSVTASGTGAALFVKPVTRAYWIESLPVVPRVMRSATVSGRWNCARPSRRPSHSGVTSAPADVGEAPVMRSFIPKATAGDWRRCLPITSPRGATVPSHDLNSSELTNFSPSEIPFPGVAEAPRASSPEGVPRIESSERSFASPSRARICSWKPFASVTRVVICAFSSAVSGAFSPRSRAALPAISSALFTRLSFSASSSTRVMTPSPPRTIG